MHWRIKIGPGMSSKCEVERSSTDPSLKLCRYVLRTNWTFPPDYLFSPVRPKDESFRWATNLKSALEQHRKTHEDLAEALDVDLTRVEAWLNISQRVAPETQKQIASWLDVSTHDIFAGAKAEATGE